MKLPFVSRAAFEAMQARADAEHENAQVLRRQLVDTEAALKSAARDADTWKTVALEAKARDASHIQLRDVGIRQFDDLMTRYHDVTGRIAGIAEQLTAPKAVHVAQPAPDFQSFPPLVASALAVATAGFKQDAQREIYAWAQSELQTKSAEEVAAVLRVGLPVRIEAEELH